MKILRNNTVGIITLSALLSLSSCAPSASPESKPLRPGEGRIEVPGGQVWYRIVGEGKGTPLLLLHGGPGATSYALGPLEKIGADRPVIFYDQLGCGRSDTPDDPSLWTVERFVEELAQVRSALGLEEVHIFGHSWGSMLAVEYVLTRAPKGIRSLILAGPVLDVPRFLRDADRLRADLPVDVQETLRNHEEAETYDSPEYQAATLEFYKRHLCRIDPPPREMQQSLESFGWQVYSQMWGPTEFHATGPLKDFDRTDRLAEISLPTLLTVGRFDEATPETAASFETILPNARLHIFEDSSHMTMLEEPEEYVRVISDFLREVESPGDP